MEVWIIRKHPPMPYFAHRGHIKQYVIDEICYTKEEADAKTKRLNAKATTYLYTVQKLTIKVE